MRSLHHLETLDPKYSCVNMAASDSHSVLRIYTPVLNGTAIMGLSSTGGTLTTYFAYHLAGLTSAYPPPAGGRDAVGVLVSEVAARCLDDILDERGERERVVAVKMDIEGHEPAALRGAERLFREQAPLLMIEGANRNPAVVELMQGYGYFHAARQKNRLVPHPETSNVNDGYWVHPDRAERYRASGIM
jgi:FkbM family methyltransferase